MSRDAAEVAVMRSASAVVAPTLGACIVVVPAMGAAVFFGTTPVSGSIGLSGSSLGVRRLPIIGVAMYLPR